MGHRRGRGEGTIGQRPDGRWWARVDLGFRDGKRLRKFLYADTRGDVADKLNKVLTDVRNGLPVAVGRQTVGQYLAHWLEHVIRPKIRERTWLTYEGIIRLYLKPGLGRVSLHQLTPQRIQAWMNGRHAAGTITASRCKYARAVLRLALNQAVAWSLIQRNPAAGKLVTLPRHRRHEIRPLNPDQARVLLASIQGHRWEALFTVALAIGLRLGEAVGLRWQDVDLPGAQLHIRQTMQRTGGDPVIRHKRFDEQKRLAALLKATEPARGTRDQGAADLARLLQPRRALVQTIAAATDEAARDQAQADLARNARARGRALSLLRRGKPDPARDVLRAQLATARAELRKVQSVVTAGEPKTPRSRRTIALPALVVKALEAHRKRQLETRLAVGKHWQEHGLVFTSRIGTPIDGRNLHATYKGVLRAAGLPDIRFHDLRHTAATLLLAQGVSPRTIMETLGHSQISLTLDTYAHVLPALQEDAARKMDAILTGTGA